MDNIVIVSSQPDRLEDGFLEEIKQITSVEPNAEDPRLCSQGRHLDIDAAVSSPGNIYTPLNDTFKTAIIFRDECSKLLANDLTLCWLAQLLLDMGQGSTVYLEMPPRQLKNLSHRVSAELIKTRLPGAGLELLDNHWVRLDWSADIQQDKEKLRTSYKYLHGVFDEFWQTWRGIFGSDDKSYAEATRQYIYGLRGANTKGYDSLVILQEYFGTNFIHGLDFGGRAGFMAAELAATGHRMTVLDFDKRYIELGKWIQEKCRLSSQVDLGVSDATEIDTLEGQYNMIGFYEALPGIGTEYAPKIFRECIRLLLPGGLIIVQEGSFKAGREPGDPWRERVFALDELINDLTDNAGEPILYKRITGTKTCRENVDEKKGGIVAVVRKPL